MFGALTFCLSLIASDDEREDRLGDLAECYSDYLATLRPEEARRLYRRDLLSCIVATAKRRLGDFFDRTALPCLTAMLIAVTGFVCFARAAGPTWWELRGFERNPGYLVTENRIDYPVCTRNQDGDSPGTHRTEAKTRTVLLPRSARIVRIDCPAGRGAISDNTYTSARAVTATGNDIRYLVVWRE